MSRLAEVIPLAEVERIATVQAKGRSMAQVKAQEGCAYILNSYFYDLSTGRPVGHVKARGEVLSQAAWNCYGLSWDTGADVRMEVIPDRGGENWLSGVELLAPGRGPGAELDYPAAYGGRRGRSAVLLAGERLVLYCSKDGTSQAKTPEELRDELAELGREYAAGESLRALGLDSGGSSQCMFPGGEIHSSRRAAGYLCVWVKKKEDGRVKGRYRVVPSVGVNIRSGPGSGFPKGGAYSRGTTVEVLELRDGWGRTKEGWVCMDYLEAAPDGQEGQRRTDSGVAIVPDLIPPGSANRPGGVNACTYITVHETGNTAQGADAAAHGAYLKSEAAARDKVSWHYTVDDRSIVQHLPDGESAYHAGDGARGPGNLCSIGIEICVDRGGNFEAAKANAAALVRLLVKEHGIPLERVVQHNRWNGKDCPYTIRHTAGAWEEFLALCGGNTNSAPWYAQAQDWVRTQGVSGVDRPGDPAPRAEVWQMLYNMRHGA